RPPLPPLATSRRSPCAVMSPITSSVPTLVTTVPTGTVMTRSSPALPYICRPMPFCPRWARNWRWWRKWTRVLRFSSATSATLPPSPPSPPSGPPSGMNFSRRQPTQPLPPLPAPTWIAASSTTFVGWWYRSGVQRRQRERKRNAPPKRGPRDREASRLPGDDVDGAAALRTLGRELDRAIDQREQRVVAAQADARTRVELGAALTDDDVAGLDGLATVHLDAEALRVGVAA